VAFCFEKQTLNRVDGEASREVSRELLCVVEALAIFVPLSYFELAWAAKTASELDIGAQRPRRNAEHIYGRARLAASCRDVGKHNTSLLCKMRCPI